MNVKPALDPSGIPVIWWVATSTKKQKLSPLVQLRWCREVSAANGLYPIAVLRVPGHSRAYIEYSEAARDLPAYRQLRALLDTRRAKYLLVQARDRLGRDELVPQVEAYCERGGCRVWSGRTGQPLESIGQVYSAGMETTNSKAESLVLKSRRAGAMRRRVVEKRLPYTRPEFGYRVKRDSAGRSVGVEIDPAAEGWRLWLEQEYIAGRSPWSIAAELNAQGVPTPGGGEVWRRNTLLKILRSRFAIGEIHVTLAGESVVAQGEHPRLRTAETQGHIDRLLALRAGRSARGVSGGNPWYGIAVCDTCGSRMARQLDRRRVPQLHCGLWRRSMVERRKQCSTHLTPVSAVVAAVVEFFQRPREQTTLEQADRTAQLSAARDRLAVVRRQQRQTVRDRVKYRTAEAAFAAVLAELGEAERQVEGEIARLEGEAGRGPAIAQALATWQTLNEMEDLEGWLTDGPPLHVRRRLSGVIQVRCKERKSPRNFTPPEVVFCL